MSSLERLDGLDCIRGLMLVLILVDHIDSLTGQRTLSHLTLSGIGFSDAADVFVWCSGFLFGYVYNSTITSSQGFRITRVVKRVLQIYLAFVLSSFCVYLIGVSPQSLDGQHVFKKFVYYCLLSDQNTNSSILCLYIVLLLWVALLFELRKLLTDFGTISISISLYFIAQFLFLAGINWPENWAFKPIAWQAVIVISALVGVRYQNDRLAMRSRFIFALTSAFIAASLAVRIWQLNPFFQFPPQLNSLLRVMTDKSHWSLVRGIHLLSLVYVVVYCFPIASSFWRAGSWWPLRIVGSKPLSTFCVGVVLAELARVAITRFEENHLMKITLIVEAVMAQLLCCVLLQRFFSDDGTTFRSG